MLIQKLAFGQYNVTHMGESCTFLGLLDELFPKMVIWVKAVQAKTV